MSANTVWVAPGASRFACLCERCLDERAASDSLLDALHVSVVRGTLAPETTVASVRCRNGHEVLIRRGDRPPKLRRPDPGQLQLA